MSTGKRDSPAVLGRYPAASRAPAGMRRVLKLGEITRLINEADTIREAYGRLEEAEYGQVRYCRERGVSWESIGWLRGVSGSAVRQRFFDRLVLDGVET